MTLGSALSIEKKTWYVDPGFRAGVLAGLAKAKKAIEPRWFYDHQGSELFELITQLPEYYPTRAETEILTDYAKQIAKVTGPIQTLVEYGSGSSTKTPLVLAATKPKNYVPIDISGAFLKESVTALERQFEDVAMSPLEADFAFPVTLPNGVRGPCLGFFPGSTIGNMDIPDAIDVLRLMTQTLGRGAYLLIGIDRVKSKRTLIPAYNDTQGITARFNINLLERINRELSGTVPIDAFQHKAIWNSERSRVEMHLIAKRDLAFDVAGQRFRMASGESIHTENSHKYDNRTASLVLRGGHWEPIREWTDRAGLFSVFLARSTSHDQSST
ncbi:L-histidine N(alpha)-methyltransferase [Dyella humicola]|uniref:L-histidine N(alpha)-methyltransferase n=1 Tax=Dyella humicola TaxID=2992126 RepID=UPI0022586532|nr:L-histidine N(alpha)-methyltransferase [Dyella humicola]